LQTRLLKFPVAYRHASAMAFSKQAIFSYRAPEGENAFNNLRLRR